MSKTLNSVRWIFFSSILRNLIKLLVFFFVILKYISRHDIGVFNEFTLIIMLPLSITSLSLDYLFIVDKRRTRLIEKSLYQLSILSGIVFSVLIFAASHVISIAYKAQELSLLLKIFSPVVLIHVLRRNIKFKLQKQLDFRTISIAETANVLIYCLLILFFSEKYPNAWCLIASFVIGDIAEMLLILSKNLVNNLKLIINSFNFAFLSVTAKILKSNKKFCFYSTVTHIIGYLSANSHVLILGLFYAPTYLAILYLANQMIGIPMLLITNSLNEVFFPNFAKLSKEEISERILRYSFIVFTLIWPLLFLYAFSLLKLVPLFLPEKWINSLPIIKILIFLMMSTILISPISSIPIIMKRTDLELIWKTGSLIFKTIALIIGGYFSFTIAIICYVIASVISGIVLLSISLNLVGFSFTKYMIHSLKSFLALPIIVFIFFYLEKFNFITSCLTFIIVFITSIFINDIVLKGKIKKEIRFILSK